MMTPATSIFVAHFDIVHGCQLRCVGCPNSTLQPKVRHMAVEDFQRALGNVDVERIHTLRLFNFGEALLHPELSRIVACIPQQRWRALNVEISTNAQHVYWDDFEEMLKQGVLTRLVVSCDGDGTADSYEALRPPATWDGLMEFLTRAKALRDQFAPNLELITRTVCPPEPAENRARWRSILEPLGWTPQFRRWMDLPEASMSLSGRVVIAPKGACLFVEDEAAFPLRAWDGQMHLLVVNTDGEVIPCCQHPNAGVLGNLFTQTYNEVLAGSRRAAFVQGLNQNRAAMGVCGHCDVGGAANPGPSFLAGMDIG